MLRISTPTRCASKAVPRLRIGIAVTIIVAAAATTISAQPEFTPEQTAKGLAVFKKHIRPVLTDRCLNCHGGKFMESELNVSTRDKLLTGGKEGPAIVPGDAAESLLYKVITHSRLPNMPYEENKLSDDTIARFVEWINLGAPYDGPLSAKKK